MINSSVQIIWILNSLSSLPSYHGFFLTKKSTIFFGCSRFLLFLVHPNFETKNIFKNVWIKKFETKFENLKWSLHPIFESKKLSTNHLKPKNVKIFRRLRRQYLLINVTIFCNVPIVSKVVLFKARFQYILKSCYNNW